MRIATIAFFGLAAGAFVPAAEPVRHLVYRSVDAGRTWTLSASGLPEHARVNAFGALDALVFAGTDAGIFLSADAGQTWKAAPGGRGRRVLGFATIGPTIYAGTDRGGILSSTDRGVNWERLSAFPALMVRSLAADGGRLYVGTEEDGVFVTRDGISWTPMSDGLPGRRQVFALAVVQGRLLAGLYAQGLHIWNEETRSWSRAGPVTPLVLATSGNTLLVGHNPGGILRSGDRGARWEDAQAAASGEGELPGGAPVWAMAADGGSAVAGAAAGIYYSGNEGRTWARARAGLPRESPGTAFLVRGDLVLAGTIVRGAN